MDCVQVETVSCFDIITFCTVPVPITHTFIKICFPPDFTFIFIQSVLKQQQPRELVQDLFNSEKIPSPCQYNIWCRNLYELCVSCVRFLFLLISVVTCVSVISPVCHLVPCVSMPLSLRGTIVLVSSWFCVCFLSMSL